MLVKYFKLSGLKVIEPFPQKSALSPSSCVPGNTNCDSEKLLCDMILVKTMRTELYFWLWIEIWLSVLPKKIMKLLYSRRLPDQEQRYTIVILKGESSGWINSSVVKKAFCSYREPNYASHYPCWVAQNYL